MCQIAVWAKIGFISIALFFQFTCGALAYERIISLSPVVSEWTSEILGKVQTQKSLVGVSEYSIYPKWLDSTVTVGPYFKLNVEKIAGLKPDLVLGSLEYNSFTQIEQLKRLGIVVMMLPKEKFPEMPNWIRGLSHILHKESAGEELAKRWTSEVKDLASKKTKIKSLFLELDHQPLITVGGESFLNEAFSIIGYENIFKNLGQGYPKVSKEQVLKLNPAALFILDHSGNKKDLEDSVQDWKKFGKTAVIISGDQFARCSFLLLKGLREL